MISVGNNDIINLFVLLLRLLRLPLFYVPFETQAVSGAYRSYVTVQLAVVIGGEDQK